MLQRLVPRRDDPMSDGHVVMTARVVTMLAASEEVVPIEHPGGDARLGLDMIERVRRDRLAPCALVVLPFSHGREHVRPDVLGRATANHELVPSAGDLGRSWHKTSGLLRPPGHVALSQSDILEAFLDGWADEIDHRCDIPRAAFKTPFGALAPECA